MLINKKKIIFIMNIFDNQSNRHKLNKLYFIFIYTILLHINNINSINIPFTIDNTNYLNDNIDNNDEDFLVDIPIRRSLNEDSKIMNINIGYPQQHFVVNIDTGSFDLWVHTDKCKGCLTSQRLYNPSKSTSLLKETTREEAFISYGIGFVSGNKYNDNVGLDNQSLKQVRMDFIGAESSHVKIVDGMIGLGRNKDSRSLIYRLYDEKLIPNLLFSIYTTNDGNGILSIGESPKSSEKYSECNLIADSKHWSCNFKSVQFKNENSKNGSQIEKDILMNNEEFIFDTGATMSILSNNLFTQVTKELFEKYIQSNTCQYSSQTIQSLQSFICKDSIRSSISSFPDIIFNVNNNKIIIKSDKLFTFDYKSFRYVFLFHSMTFYPSMNIFGMNILKRYYIVYNLQQEKIQFSVNPDTFSIKESDPFDFLKPNPSPNPLPKPAPTPLPNPNPIFEKPRVEDLTVKDNELITYNYIRIYKQEYFNRMIDYLKTLPSIKSYQIGDIRTYIESYVSLADMYLDELKKGKIDKYQFIERVDKYIDMINFSLKKNGVILKRLN